MKSGRHYRYVSRDKSYATRWRRLPSDGLENPSKGQRKKLGDGYSVTIRASAKRATS